MILRPYQTELKNNIYNEWNSGAQNVCAVLPCGAGKTAVFSNIIGEHVGSNCIIAHRRELVSQISVTLAHNKIMHRIIAPDDVVRWIIKLQVEETGQNFYDCNAPCAVAGVDTITRRDNQHREWMNQVSLWVTDECHHITKANKWGIAAELFPNARGLGVTATPLRADGKGLGRHADGIMDSMVVGPSMRELINQGFLCDYRIFCPQSDIDLHNVAISKATGDFNPHQLKKEVRKSHIIGDVVSHYLKFAPGKQGVTFATDIETATDIANQFKLSGIKAEIITSTTPGKIRVELLRRFKNKQIQQLINVDILGEGFDVPNIEVVSMARPTESYGLYVQQFGRDLRLSPGKTHGIIIDHVGNVLRHGLPDAPRIWTLDRRERRVKGDRDKDIIPLRQCLNPECAAPYEAIYNACPFCGHLHVPPGRSKPEFVDGDLTELDPATLAQMRGELDKMNETPKHMINRMTKAGADGRTAGNAGKLHGLRQTAQSLVRESIAWWAGHHETLGRDKSEIYKRFYFKFGMDMIAAQCLSAKESEQLAIQINKSIDELVNMR